MSEEDVVVVSDPVIEVIEVDKPGVEEIVEILEPGVPGVDGPPGEQGSVGPAGETGPEGPAGSGVDKNYVYHQIVISATWTITHNLEKFPSVSVVDSGGNEVEGDIQFETANVVKLTFNAPFSGTAYLN
jgi:hypothetical protein